MKQAYTDALGINTGDKTVGIFEEGFGHDESEIINDETVLGVADAFAGCVELEI